MLRHPDNSSKGGTNSPSEIPPLPQYLSLNPITLGNQKHVRAGDIKRVLGFPLTNMSDGNSLGVSQPRPFHPAVTEELINMKEIIESGSKKAKDRSNMFRELIFKLDKYRENLSSRKRLRSENVSDEKSGMEFEKPGAQLRGNPRDVISQRQDQRPKNTVVVKRVRTSIGETRVDGKVVTSPRQPSSLERNDKSQISNATLHSIEEKVHKVPGGGEVWAKKIKRKRSVTAMGNRLVNGDGESKQLLHSKPSTDSKLRSSDGQILRSKNSFGVDGINRVSGCTEAPGSSTSTPLKNEPDIVYSLNHRMDMFEPRASVKGSRINIQEGDLASVPGLLIRGKFSRTPRAGTSVVADPSPSSQPMPGGCSEDYELTSNVNKISPVVIAGDKKRVLGSSSQPMAQWVGQRTHKKARLRRENLVSPRLNPEETTPNLSDSLGLLDCSARSFNVGSGGSLHDYSSSKNYAKVKKELDHSPSPFGVFDSDGSEAWENGMKGNGVDGGEVSLTTASLSAGEFVPSGKKQKLSSHEHGGVHKQGRSGRGLSHTKTGTPPVREKMDDSPVANITRTTLSRGSNKVRSKSGRTSTKKSKDRSHVTQVGSVINSSPSDCTGEFDDDWETLVAAANLARNGYNLAFGGPFWSEIKQMFGPVNVDNESFIFLKQQVHSMEDFDETMFSGANHNVRGNVSLKDHLGGTQQNHLDLGEAAAGNHALSGNFFQGKLDKSTPLYERILSALIEDENEEIFHRGEGKVLSLQCVSDDSHCGSCNHIDGESRDRDRVESEGESAVDIWNQKVGFLDKVYCDKSATSCSLKSLSTSAYSNDHSVVDDDYCHSDAGMVSETCSNDVGHLQKKESTAIACTYLDSQYEMMSLDERLLLELRSIDLCPDALPDLSEERENIHHNIVELRKDLMQKIEAKKDSLAKIERAVVDEGEMEKRKLVETAMDQLVVMAYRNQMTCRGGNSSKAAVRKVSKQVALAFIKRTLTRYQKYQETGISSFADHSLADILFSPSTEVKSVDGVGSGTASNTFNDVSNNPAEATGAATSGISERRYSHGENARDVLVKPGIAFHKGRKEVLIDDVGCASSKMTPIKGSMPVGPKGKRGERHKNLNNSLNGKAKSKQKNNPHPTQRPVSRPESEIALGDPSYDPLDLTKIGLNGNQDLTSLLDFDMDGEQDPEAVGLEIPPWDDVGLEVPPWDDQFVLGL